MWVFGDYQSSTGCMSEIAYCINYNIYCQIMSENCIIQNKKQRKCSDCGLIERKQNSFKCMKRKIQKIYEKVKILGECN